MSNNDTPDDGHLDRPSDDADKPFFSSSQDDSSVGAGQPVKRKGFFRRHPVVLALTALAVVLLIGAGGAGVYLWWLDSQLGNIKRVDVGLGLTKTGQQAQDKPNQPLNILLLGTDDGNSKNTVADELNSGHWVPGSHRSDTIIIMHVPANRQSVQLVSIPRDSWVKVNGYPGDVNGYSKINAAFSWGGPKLAITTVEQLTHITINHLAIIDWNGFKDLSTALGGVRVYVPATVYDSSQHVTWTKGWHTLQGDQALQYVRQRHGLANGDFDRINRQQNFMRATMSKLLSSAKNPFELTKVVGVITQYLIVDSSWDNSEIRSLALSMRNLSSSNVTFLTAPFGSYDTVAGQSIVRLDPTKSQLLFRDLNAGKLSQYLSRYPGSTLPNTTSVN
ncbi:MAG: LCP family protein [Nocardioidaceae bacterium]